MLSPVADDPVLAEQLTYYRRRAADYDRAAFGDVTAAGRRIAGIVAALRPTGDVLELACGTGMWTGALAGWADTMTALDAAPEMLAGPGQGVRPPGRVPAGRRVRLAAGPQVRHGVLRVLAIACTAGPVRPVLGAATGLAGARRSGTVRGRAPRHGGQGTLPRPGRLPGRAAAGRRVGAPGGQGARRSRSRSATGCPSPAGGRRSAPTVRTGWSARPGRCRSTQPSLATGQAGSTLKSGRSAVRPHPCPPRSVDQSAF